MRRTILRHLAVMAGVVLSAHVAVAQDPEPRKFDISRLFQEVGSIVHRYYPEAMGSISLNNEMKFEYETQLFMVHFPTQTGVWQDPEEVLGPKRNGIVIRISIGEGAPPPRAAIGNHFDYCYFTDYIGTYHSETADAHVNLLVRYPRGYPAELAKDLEVLLSGFEIES